MRKFWKKGFTLLLGTLLAVSLIGCGSSADGTGSTAGGSGTANIVNIGVTGSLVSFNPFVMDMSEMNHYSSGGAGSEPELCTDAGRFHYDRG